MSDADQMKRRLVELENTLKHQREQLTSQLARKQKQIQQQQQHLKSRLVNNRSEQFLSPYPTSSARISTRANYRGGYKGFVRSRQQPRFNSRTAPPPSSSSPLPPTLPIESSTLTTDNQEPNELTKQENITGKTDSKFVKTQHGRCLVNSNIYDADFKKRMIEMKRLNKAKKILLKYIYKNRIKYNYKNHFTLDSLKFVLTNSGNTLSLISTEFEDTKKELSSVDDLKVLLVYNNRKYVKDYNGDYQIQTVNHSPLLNLKEPCVYYTRSGVCKNPRCRHAHPTNHIALCPGILNPKLKSCPTEKLKKECLLSHTPTQCNTPSCKYFQQGHCSNANCIYSHKLENRNSLICRQFAINGYCDKGRSCQLLHYFQCPDYQEFGYCLKSGGGGCKLNHDFKLGCDPPSSYFYNPIFKDDNEPSSVQENQLSGVIRNADNDDVSSTPTMLDENSDFDNGTPDYSILEKELLSSLQVDGEDEGSDDDSDSDSDIEIHTGVYIEQNGSDEALKSNKDYIQF